MDVDLRSKVNIFKEYYDNVNKSLRLDSSKIKVLESFLYTITNEEIDYIKLKEVRKYIKKSDIGFNFNSEMRKVMSIFLYSNSNYEKIIKDTAMIYNHLISKGFELDKLTEFISFNISVRFPEIEYDNIIKKMIYIKENIESRYSIGKECSLRNLCFLNLSMFTKESGEILKDYFDIYDTLINEEVNKEEALYSVSTLMLSDNKNYLGRLEKLKDIKKIFYDNNIVLEKNYYLLLGLSSLIVEKSDKFVDNVLEVHKCLYEKKYLKKNILMLLSIALVLNEYIEVTYAEYTNFFSDREVNILNRLLEYLSVIIV